MELSQDFFESSFWLDGNEFSEKEALLDLFSCHESGLAESEATPDFFGPTHNLFGERWGWPIERVSSFIDKLTEHGWWDSNLCVPSVNGVKPWANKDQARKLHKTYLEVYPEHSRYSLVARRVEAYNRLWACGLGLEDDPQGVFRKILNEVRRSEFYMQKAAYHDPTSLFRSDLKCEQWLTQVKYSEVDKITDENQMERDRVGRLGMDSGDPVESPDPVTEDSIDYRSLYESMDDSKKERAKARYKHSRRPFANMRSSFKSDLEKGLWHRIIREEAS
tara:strand:- start:2347 stop:3177 length:831 start_codon:yes stop_codon:yes gene_type:complete